MEQDPSLLPEGARIRARTPDPLAAAPPPPPDIDDADADVDENTDDAELLDDANTPADFQRGNRHRTLKVVATVVPRAMLPLSAGRVGIAATDLPKATRAMLKETGTAAIIDTENYTASLVVMEHDFRDFESNTLIYHAEGFLFQVIEGDSIEFTLELSEGEKVAPVARDMRPTGWLEADADAR